VLRSEQDLKHRIETFKQYKTDRDRELSFQIFARNVLTQIHLKEKNNNIQVYSETKLKERTLEWMKWYLQERRDKKDMASIAYAQLASTIIERTWVIFKYIIN